MRARLSLLLILLTAPLAAVDPGLIDLIGPEANFVLGIRVSAINESPLVKNALAEASGGTEGIGALLGSLGDNPLEGLEELLLLGRVDPGADSEEMNGLLLASGDFTGDRIQTAFCADGCEEEAYGGLKLFHGERDGEAAAFVKLSSRYAAAGKSEHVKALLQRRAAGQKPQLAADLNDWVRGLDKHHIWLAAKGPFEAPAGDAGGPPLGEIAEQLKGFGLGITLGDDVQFGLQVEADNEAAAEQLLMMTRGLLMMFRAAEPTKGGEANEAAALLKNLKLRRDGGHVYADLSVPAAQLESTVRSGMTDAAGDEEPTASPPAGGEAQPAREQPRSKEPIRIYGLGDEPVEVRSNPR